MADPAEASLPIYNMKAVVEATGISAETLRSWERRFGVPRPARGASNYRMYADDDLRTLRWLQARLAEGLTISRAVALLRAQGGPARGDAAIGAATPNRLARDLAAACVRYDERAAERAMAHALARYPPEQVCLAVLTPALVALGVTAAEHPETLGPAHFASVVIRSRLLALYELAQSAGEQTQVLLACAPGDTHDLGLLMVALFARRAGLHTLFLGTIGDQAVVMETIRERHPAVVCLSAASPETATRALDLAEAVARQPNDVRPVVVVGGTGFPAGDERVYRSGARWGGADADSALRVLLAVLTDRPPA